MSLHTGVPPQPRDAGRGDSSIGTAGDCQAWSEHGPGPPSGQLLDESVVGVSVELE
jgi:hypothetical protein